MEPHQPILVATDLSARSDRAIDRAALLAEEWHVTLLVCHVVEARSRGAGDLQRMIEAIRATLPETSAQCEVLVREGSAPEALVNAATERDCRLIVTGVARYNQLGDFLVGTAVDRIIREALSPVLVVKQRPRGAYRSVLIATDFSPCSRQALLTAGAMFPDATLHLVHAFHVPFEGILTVEDNADPVRKQVEQEFDAFLLDPAVPEDVRSRVERHLRYGETQAVVQDMADERSVDLIAMGTHGRSGIAKAVFGSMAESLLRCSHIDALIVREPG